jgi:ribose transport system substrate-binding protein
VQGPTVKVVGTGGSKNGIQAIRDGLVYGTMNQSPSADAQQGLEIALGIVAGKPPAEKRTIIPMPKITAANVSQFQGNGNYSVEVVGISVAGIAAATALLGG